MFLMRRRWWRPPLMKFSVTLASLLVLEITLWGLGFLDISVQPEPALHPTRIMTAVLILGVVAVLALLEW